MPSVLCSAAMAPATVWALSEVEEVQYSPAPSTSSHQATLVLTPAACASWNAWIPAASPCWKHVIAVEHSPALVRKVYRLSPAPAQFASAARHGLGKAPADPSTSTTLMVWSPGGRPVVHVGEFM